MFYYHEFKVNVALISSVLSPSPVIFRLTSSFTCQLISIIITTLIIHHSFTRGSKPTFSTNPSHLRLLLPTRLPSWQWDWIGPIMLIILFLVSHFNFLFIPCGRLSWLPVSFLLHVKYTVLYGVLLYRIIKLINLTNDFCVAWMLNCLTSSQINCSLTGEFYPVKYDIVRD